MKLTERILRYMAQIFKKLAIVDGSIDITANGTVDVENYQTAVVNVPSEETLIATAGTITEQYPAGGVLSWNAITGAGSYDVYVKTAEAETYTKFGTVTTTEYDFITLNGDNASVANYNVYVQTTVNDKTYTSNVVNIPIVDTDTGASGEAIEIATEAEMTAVLTNATDDDIGKIYKYTGTTGTYENGALYVVESNATLISFTIDGTEYQAEEGMTWQEFVDSSYNDGKFTAVSGVPKYNGYYLTYDEWTACAGLADEIMAGTDYETSTSIPPS